MLGRGWSSEALRGLNQLRVHDLKFLSVPLKFNKQSVFILVIWEKSLSWNVFNLHEREEQIKINDTDHPKTMHVTVYKTLCF